MLKWKCGAPDLLLLTLCASTFATVHWGPIGGNYGQFFFELLLRSFKSLCDPMPCDAMLYMLCYVVLCDVALCCAVFLHLVAVGCKYIYIYIYI